MNKKNKVKKISTILMLSLLISLQMVLPIHATDDALVADPETSEVEEDATNSEISESEEQGYEDTIERGVTPYALNGAQLGNQFWHLLTTAVPGYPAPLFPGAASVTQAQLDAVTTLQLFKPSQESYDVTGNGFEGLKYFTNLETLDINGHSIDTIDLTQNTKLVSLNVSGNRLTSIDLSKNIELDYADISFQRHHGEIAAGRPNAKQDNVGLSLLDITKNTKLTYLKADQNNIGGDPLNPGTDVNNYAFDISKNVMLDYVDLSMNCISTIDLSTLKDLRVLFIYQNFLTNEKDAQGNITKHGLDFSKNLKLEALNISQNILEEVDVTMLPELWYFTMYKIQASEIDLTQNPKLTFFHGQENFIHEFDFSNNVLLGKTHANMDLRAKTPIDIKGQLDISSNWATELDVSMLNLLFFEHSTNPNNGNPIVDPKTQPSIQKDQKYKSPVYYDNVDGVWKVHLGDVMDPSNFDKVIFGPNDTTVPDEFVCVNGGIIPGYQPASAANLSPIAPDGTGNRNTSYDATTGYVTLLGWTDPNNPPTARWSDELQYAYRVEHKDGSVGLMNVTLTLREVKLPLLETIKTVVDTSGDLLASPSEELTYLITTTNKGAGDAENIILKDELLSAKNHLTLATGNIVSVAINGVTSTYTIAQLQAGITITIPAGGTMSATFKATVKENLDVSTVSKIENIAYVGDTFDDADINTGDTDLKTIKGVVDTNGDTYASPGEALTYTITSTNKGAVDAKNIVLKDDLATAFNHLDFAIGNIVEVNINGVKVFYSIAQLRAGITITIPAGKTMTTTFVGTVKTNLDILTVNKIENIAHVGDTNDDADIDTGDADLTTIKGVVDTNGDTYASPGEKLFYTITTENSGLVDATDIILKDDLATAFNHLDFASGNIVRVSIDGTTTMHTIAQLRAGITITIPAGKTMAVTFEATVKTNLNITTVNKIENVAYVGDSSDDADINTGNPSLSTVKEVKDTNGDTYASPGEELTYTITTENLGAVDAADIILKDDLATAFNYLDFLPGNIVEVDIDGTITNHTIAQLRAGITITIPAGKTMSVTFVATVKTDLDITAVSKIENIAYVGDSNDDADINTGDIDLTTVKGVADTNGDTYASPGEKLTYTITTENRGLIDAKNIILKDDLATAFNHLDFASGNIVSVSINGTTTTHTIAQLRAGITITIPAGKTMVVTFETTVKTNLNITTVNKIENVAYVGNTNDDADIKTGEADLTTVKAVADTNGDTFASPGEKLTYTITTENTGLVDATDIILKDELTTAFNHLDFTSGAIVEVVIDGSTTTHTIAQLRAGITITIPAGKTMVVTFEATVKTNLNITTVNKIENVAYVGDTNDDADINTGNPSLSTVKEVEDTNGDTYASPSEELTYTITTENLGAVDAVDIILKDDLATAFNYLDFLPGNIVEVDIDGIITNHTIAQLRSGITITIPAGKTMAVTFMATVKADLDITAVSKIENVAYVGDTNDDADINTGDIDLTTIKTVVDDNGDTYASPGEKLFYSITTENSGLVDATDIIMKDDLALAFNHLDFASGNIVRVSIDGTTTTYTIAQLRAGITITIPAGATMTVTFEATVKTDLNITTVNKIENVAYVGNTNDDADINTGNPSLSTVKEVVDTNGDTYVSPGEELTYTITTENLGAVDAVNIILKDDLVTAFNYLDFLPGNIVEVDIDGTITNHTIAQLRAGITITIPAGKTMSVTFAATVKADLDVTAVSKIENIAYVGDTSDDADINTGDSDLTTVKAVVDDNGDTYASPGEELTYTITTENTGLVDAKDIILKDDLATAFNHLDFMSGNIVSVTIGTTTTMHTIAQLRAGITITIPAGKTMTVLFLATVKADLDTTIVNKIENIAYVGDTSDDADIATGDSNLTTLKAVADHNNDTFASPGEELTYTITSTNLGLVSAENVVLKDPLTTAINHLDFAGGAIVEVKIDGIITKHTIEDLKAGFMVTIPAGKTMIVTFKATVKKDLNIAAVSKIENKAFVGTTTGEAVIDTKGDVNAPIVSKPSVKTGDSTTNVLIYQILFGACGLLVLKLMKSRREYE